MKVSRRDALTKLAAGGVGAVLAPAIIRGQSSPIIVAGRPVEILVRPRGEFTVRISLRPIVGGRPQPVINRGALAEPVGGNESRVETDDMVVSVVEGATTTITVRRRGRIVQTLSLSRDESTIAFAIGNGPIFGLGEGTIVGINGVGGQRNAPYQTFARVAEGVAVDGDRVPVLAAHGDRLRLHRYVLAPERHGHDRLEAGLAPAEPGT